MMLCRNPRYLGRGRGGGEGLGSMHAILVPLMCHTSTLLDIFSHSVQICDIIMILFWFLIVNMF